MSSELTAACHVGASSDMCVSMFLVVKCWKKVGRVVLLLCDGRRLRV